MSTAGSPNQGQETEPLCELIWSTLVGSEFDKTDRSFSPEGSIDKHITKASIITALWADSSEPPVDDLVDFILRDAKRVFAIAICSGLEDNKLRRAMEFFKSRNMTDKGLPFSKARWEERAEGPSGLSGHVGSSPHSYGSVNNAHYKDLWPKIKIDKFCKQQWAFCAPVFIIGKINHDFERDTVMPFTKKDTISMAQGSFGSVFKCQVHTSHLKASENSVSNGMSTIRVLT